MASSTTLVAVAALVSSLPDGHKMTEDLGEEEEGLLVADLDFNEILKVKAMLDVHGHYSRLDLLWLGLT